MVDAVDHDIDLAIVEQISKRCPSGGDDIGQSSAFDRRNDRKFLTVIQVVKQQRALCKGHSPVMLVHLRVNMTADGHKVLPAVVVVDDKLRSPTQKGISDLSDTHFRGNIGEVSAAIVAEKGFVVVR